MEPERESLHWIDSTDAQPESLVDTQDSILLGTKLGWQSNWRFVCRSSSKKAWLFVSIRQHLSTVQTGTARLLLCVYWLPPIQLSLVAMGTQKKDCPPILFWHFSTTSNKKQPQPNQPNQLFVLPFIFLVVWKILNGILRISWRLNLFQKHSQTITQPVRIGNFCLSSILNQTPLEAHPSHRYDKLQKVSFFRVHSKYQNFDRQSS